MNEGYIVILAMSLAFAALLWSERKRRKYPESGEDGSGSNDDGGGGRWGNTPKGRPPSGPDRDVDEQFHAIADAVGKTIEIEKSNEEKVLT